MLKRLWPLISAAALLMSGVPYLLLVGGFVGHQLAPTEAMATLPLALLVVGTACAAFPMVKAMEVWGRKLIFLCACLILVLSSLLANWALQASSFFIFCLAALLMGCAQAVFLQFRFAAMELVDDQLAAKAASFILLSGLIAAVLGPELSQLGLVVSAKDFSGGFILLAFCALLALVVLLGFYREPAKPVSEGSKADALPWLDFFKRPEFVAAVCAAMMGYAIMSLIMIATPLTMHIHHGYELARTKEVIQGHIIAMFLPSLLTGLLISRIGAKTVIALGLVCYVFTAATALLGSALLNFWLALLVLGLGWNFMFLGGTALLASSYLAHERFQAQALNDACVFGGQALAALSAGWLLAKLGWATLLICALILVLLAFLPLVLTWRQNKAV